MFMNIEVLFRQFFKLKTLLHFKKSQKDSLLKRRRSTL